MRSPIGKIPRMLLHAAVLFSAAALCLSLAGKTAARYAAAASGSDSAQVAQFSPSQNSFTIDLSQITKPGDSAASSVFQVQNTADGTLSQVAMQCKILVKTTGNLPLRFSVLDGEGNELQTWVCSGTEGKQAYEYAAAIFAAGTVQSCQYQLKAQWPAEQNDAQFAGKTDAVYVSVSWEQVD